MEKRENENTGADQHQVRGIAVVRVLSTIAYRVGRQNAVAHSHPPTPHMHALLGPAVQKLVQLRCVLQALPNPCTTSV